MAWRYSSRTLLATVGAGTNRPRRAGELDRKPYWRADDRRASIATLVFAGPRAYELSHLVWRDVDLANGRIYICRSKTQAGLREIQLLPVLRDELAAHKARSSALARRLPRAQSAANPQQSKVIAAISGTSA